jgi:hypothetical protein
MESSSISGNAAFVNQTFVKIKTSKAQTGNTQRLINLSGSGDTVAISDEARGRLQSAQGARKTDAHQTNAENSDGGRGAGQTGTKNGAASVVSSGSTSSASSNSEDEVAKLEKEIRALQQEIAAITARALTDETAKSSLAVKQTEMMELMSELYQLQAQKV